MSTFPTPIICPPQSAPPHDQIPAKVKDGAEAGAEVEVAASRTIFNKTWWLFFSNVARKLRNVPEVLTGTHADRPPASNHPSSFYYETDRDVTYVSIQVDGLYQWVYLTGQMQGTLSPNEKPTDLGVNDADFRFYATDYFHQYRWSGTGWAFADGDTSEYVVNGPPHGGAPEGGLWGLCDGSAYNCAQSDGTLVSRTTQDLTNNVFIKGDTSPGAQQAAVRATWEATAKTATAVSQFSGGAVTEDESSHTHVVQVNSSDNGAAGADFSFAHPGSYVSDAGSPHNHGITNVNAPQAAHEHTLTNALSQLKVFSEANGGLPLRIAVTYYIRR